MPKMPPDEYGIGIGVPWSRRQLRSEPPWDDGVDVVGRIILALVVLSVLAAVTIAALSGIGVCG